MNKPKKLILGIFVAVAIIAVAGFALFSENSGIFQGRMQRVTKDPQTSRPVMETSHQKALNAFQTGLKWESTDFFKTDWAKPETFCPGSGKDCVVSGAGFEQDPKTGDFKATYKIYLTDEAKKALASTIDDKFYFKFVYKPYWGANAESLIQSSEIGFKVENGKLVAGNSTKNENVYFDKDGNIIVKVVLPWPGLAINSELTKYGEGNWGKYDIDMYFYDKTDSTQIAISSKYVVKQLARPNLRVKNSGSGCVIGAYHDFTVVNDGGLLPLDAYNRILFYLSGGDAIKLDKAFGDATPVMTPGGSTDWECYNAGYGTNIWLVRDTIKGDTTIFNEKIKN
ncbi:hypothetical protein M0P48_03350 [Candidatus Gracilibacteria bacterium]|jgi:hypothetical protein|nr:hypothetical protein [Candidatus Gracilibacteria bacterium]